MATIEELVVTLSAETSGLRSELKAAQVSLEKSTNSMTKAVDSFAKDGAKSTSFFQNAFATMAGYVGGVAVTSLISGTTDLFKSLFQNLIVDGVKAASDTQVAMNNLLNAVARTGQSVSGASKEFADFAGELQNTTKYGDDAVLASAAMLENLTRLDKEGLKAATKSTIDFAAAMNLDLNTASQTIGKAIEGNVGALGRYGIKVDAGATKAQTLANVMKALNERFGGAAAAQLQTYSGATTALGNTWQDFTKVFGNAVVENKAFINVINAIKNVVADFTGSLDSQQISNYFSNILIGATDVAGGILATSSAITSISRVVLDTVEGIGVAIGAAGAAAYEAAQGNFSGAADIISGATKQIGDSFKGNFDENIFDEMATKLGDVKAAAVSGAAATAAGFTATDSAVKGASGSIREIASTLKDAEDASIAFAQTLLDSSASAKDIYATELDDYVAQRDAQLLTDEEFYAKKQELLLNSQQAEQELLQAGLDQANATAEQRKAAQETLSKQQNVAFMKFQNEQTKSEEQNQKEREQNFSASLGVIAGLANSNNKTLAAIGKAAAITQATIDGFAAVQKALASAPPPFNFALAGLVGVATAANVAKIAGVPLATGIDSVPGIGSRDNFPAVLAPGERVVPTKTNEDLTKFLSGEGTAGAQITVNITMNDIFSSDPREMGLKIINTINETAQANGVKILGGSIA